ncbi:hypothetical protein NQ315_011835 [Exocentrus adspersus]|uniref:Vacuolar ATP synthase subunit S1 n=1 Tax=Exocentrus adspersus TaxID=1586481 RepID=A0AAV8W1I7_9CUCU|nr:hypothetical protein NQ315_011835 [Exocentrus adspersus]
MLFTFTLIVVFLNVYTSDAAVFLWSNKKLQISPLRRFAEEEFLNLTRELDNPDVYYFRSPSRVSPGLKEVIEGYYSAYIPNGDIAVEEEIIDLSGDDVYDVETVREALDQANKSSNILSVVVIPHKVYKREVEYGTEEAPSEVKQPQPKGPVIYKAQNSKNELFALLYSSKPLLLRSNDSETYLGRTDPDMIIYDTRLNVNIAEGGRKITLRFSFSWLNGYWSLTSVKVTDTGSDKSYNLTTDEDISAPAHFSYHCNGVTAFSDADGVELQIYDLQVQVDSRNGKFGDANDCVSFTTAPIWSGLFVTTLLGIGLIVALTAIMDIKTMDKFDNYKTKNLSITISE